MRREFAAAGNRAEVSSLKVFKRADVAQLVEHSLGKGEVTSSILVISSRNASAQWIVHSEQSPDGVKYAWLEEN